MLEVLEALEVLEVLEELPDELDELEQGGLPSSSGTRTRAQQVAGYDAGG